MIIPVNTFKTWSLKWIIQRIKPARKKIPVPITMMEVKVTEEQKQSNLINTYFDRIYLLNLKHRSDKRLKSIHQLKQIGINAWIVDGINGSEEPHKSEYEQYNAIPLGQRDAHRLEKKYNRKMITSPGGWGVLKSKKLIFRDALQNNYKRILILQDDVLFIKDFHREFEAFISATGTNWKIIALGATQHSWNIPGGLRYKDKNVRKYDPNQKYYYPLYTDGAFALGYDRSVFNIIIREIEKMNCSFDSGPVRTIYEKFPGKCFVCQPNLIIADVSDSDLRPGRNQEEFSVKMKWDLRLYDFPTRDESNKPGSNS